MENKEYIFYIVAIIAIVAIVAMIILVSNNGDSAGMAAKTMTALKK